MLSLLFVQANLASNRSGVEGHLVVSVVVTAFESPLTEWTEPRASSATHSIHIFLQKPEKMKLFSLCLRTGLIGNSTPQILQKLEWLNHRDIYRLNLLNRK